MWYLKGYALEFTLPGEHFHMGYLHCIGSQTGSQGILPRHRLMVSQGHNISNIIPRRRWKLPFDGHRKKNSQQYCSRVDFHVSLRTHPPSTN